MDLTIELKARAEKFQELNQALLAFLPAIRKEKGCRESSIYKDAEGGEIFFISIQWDDITALEQYMQSINGSAILGAIDLLGDTVSVRVGNAPICGGIEVLKRMRSKA